MKKSHFTARLTALVAALCSTASALAAVPESFSTSNNLPPPAGTYISPALWHVLYANGIVIKDVSHNRFMPVTPPPPLGGTQDHTFNSTVDFQLSTDNGLTFNPASGNAMVTVRVKHTADVAGQSIFQTEMLALDLTSGALMLRESPTLPSKGKTTIRAVVGGYMVSSFFDIFTEVSTDGGTTWTPGQQTAHVEYRNDAGTVPPVITGSPLLPPPGDQYVSPQQWHALYAQGIVIKDVKHKFFTPSQPPPPPGVKQVHQFNSQLDLQLSTDGGNNFQFVSVAATVEVSVENKGSATSGHYDTEMLALNFTAPGGVMIRESPTLPSRGSVRIDALADGSYQIGSFFDIFTELSLNGGGTWAGATSGPVRVVLEDAAPPQPVPDPNLPPPAGEYVSPQQWHALYANGIIISNVSHNRFTQSQPPPPPGSSAVHTFNSFVDLDLVQPGQPPVHISAPAQVTVQLTSTEDVGSTRYFETEMLQLDIMGGGLPSGVMVRESPTRASLGRTSLRLLPGGLYQVDSFFDIFTEISLAGLAGPWSPATGAPATVRLRMPTPVPINIVCPADIIVPATGAAGAVVNYTVNASGGCDPAPTVVCTPPSGSLFPVGTTLVTCVASDSCGNQMTCAFNVTVTAPTVVPPAFFFPDPLLPPPGVYISPAQYHILTAAGIVIRDVRHRGFTEKQEVPPLGETRIHTFNSTVDFEVSTSGPVGPFQPASGSAQVQVRVTHTHDQGGVQFFDTEMLALDLTSGPLRLRESPTLPSRGQTSVQAVPGGHMIDSFFDIFVEVSLDGGVSWQPAPDPAHVELRPDPAQVPDIPAPSNLLPPPNDAYVSPAKWHALFAQGIIIRDVRHKLFSQSLPPPPAGGPPQIHTFQSVLDMELSQNGGQTFQSLRIPAQCQVRVSNVGSDASNTFDTEMLAMSLSLGGSLRLRESPSRPSRGMTTVQPMPDGTYAVDSFFDIFVEVNLTSGNGAWYPPTNGPVRMQLQQQAPEQQSSSPDLPPSGQEYISPQQWHALYANGIIITNVIHNQFTGGQPPPPPGQTANHNFGSSVSFQISTDGGLTFSPAGAFVDVLARVTSTLEGGDTRYFETEMLSLMISGGSLPPGVAIRESPTRASLGRTSMRLDGSGASFRISSFFDIFTEISLNGDLGPWSPVVSGPATVRLRNPGVPPISIGCPPDITVAATSAAGAVVNYPAPTVSGGCDPVPTVTCTPPSGSVFPVGTTTVTCVVKDSCGNTATCAFQVTVKKYIRKRFFPTRNLPPPNGQYISPADWHALYANGVIISNAAHRHFLQSFPPPPPGSTSTHNFGSEVNFDVSLNDGQTYEHVQGNANVTVQVGNISLPGAAEESFDTEMLALNLSGGGAGGAIMIRESPTKPSLGEVHIATAPGGFMIDSFFDIFTEISLDGGLNWSPATTPVRVELQIDPGAADTILTNPRRVGGKPTFSLNTESGLLYLIECKDDLLDPDWFTINGLPGTGEETDTTDYLGDDGKPRFYRAKVEEPPDPQE